MRSRPLDPDVSSLKYASLIRLCINQGNDDERGVNDDKGLRIDEIHLLVT
jgi:hypothetical protein